MIVLVCLYFNIDCVIVLAVYWHVVQLIICHCYDFIVISTDWNTAQQSPQQAGPLKDPCKDRLS